MLIARVCSFICWYPMTVVCASSTYMLFALKPEMTKIKTESPRPITADATRKDSPAFSRFHVWQSGAQRPDDSS